MINKKTKIYIAGHRGMVGSACQILLKTKGYSNIIVASHNKLDLRNQEAVFQFFKKERPEVVIDCAARVGGIMVNNNFPYDFLMDNMLIQNNLIKASYDLGVNKFIFLGSSCIYPRNSPQPIKEDYLLTNSLEKTNEAYALAKITGVKLCEKIFNKNKQFISLMPANLYGPNDNFDIETSHVIPALIKKIDKATKEEKNVELWGDGTPLREFMHVNDLCSAILFVLENEVKESIYNVGSGEEYSIKDIANKIAMICNFKGKISWNISYPNGTPRKLLDSSKIRRLGWKSEINFEEGITKVYEWYKNLQ